MPFLGRKSKEEVEWNRKLKLRGSRDRLSRYASKCETVLESYRKNAIEARRLENAPLARRFAAQMVLLEQQVRRAKNLQLMLNDIELSREQVGLFKSLADTAKDFAKTVAEEEITTKMAGELERDLSSAVSKSEKVDLMLGDVLDSMNEKILSVGEVDEKEIERVLGSIEEGAVKAERESVNLPENRPGEKEDQHELDRRIDEGLKKIKESRKD